MRFFIALEIPEESRIQLQVVQKEIKKILPQIHLTDPEKLHFTLAFIGEQPDTLQEQLTQVIQNASSDIPPFEITPAYLDGFPNLHHPHTIWVGVKGDIDKLLFIRERIKDGLADMKLTVDERRFTPHIAIAKSNHHIKISRELETGLEKIMAQSFDPIQIQSIKLFQSIPEHGFHRHNTLAEIFLSNSR